MGAFQQRDDPLRLAGEAVDLGAGGGSSVLGAGRDRGAGVDNATARGRRASTASAGQLPPCAERPSSGSIQTDGSRASVRTATACSISMSTMLEYCMHDAALALPGRPRGRAGRGHSSRRPSPARCGGRGDPRPATPAPCRDRPRTSRSTSSARPSRATRIDDDPPVLGRRRELRVGLGAVDDAGLTDDLRLLEHLVADQEATREPFSSRTSRAAPARPRRSSILCRASSASRGGRPQVEGLEAEIDRRRVREPVDEAGGGSSW